MRLRYAGIMENDVVDCLDGFCVSFWTQGCNNHCKGCHNPQTWDEDGGEELTYEIEKSIPDLVIKNGVHRDFSILGGEPFLNEKTRETLCHIIDDVKDKSPDSKIYCWTGYTKEYLFDLQGLFSRPYVRALICRLDYLIEGPFILSERNTNLPLRGSSNQRIFENNKEYIFTECLLKDCFVDVTEKIDNNRKSLS